MQGHDTTCPGGEVVKRLAGWAAPLAAPTLVASWYGMRFRHMPELQGPCSYLILVGIVVLVCTGLYRYLRKVGWLQATEFRSRPRATLEVRVRDAAYPP